MRRSRTRQAALAVAAALLLVSTTVQLICSPSLTAYASQMDIYTVKVESGYLALRNAKAYDAANEIGRLYSGETVTLIDDSDSEYWTVTSTKLNKTGYVNSAYLVEGMQTTEGITYIVMVSEGYLALRSEKAYDQENELGKLYTGDTVQVLDTTDEEYWYVYSVELNRQGFVNKDYLISADAPSAAEMTVSTDSSDAFLRSSASDDPANVIAQLDEGEQVEVSTTDDSQYWYVYVPGRALYGYLDKESLN